jgi:hypothetical protein
MKSSIRSVQLKNVDTLPVLTSQYMSSLPMMLGMRRFLFHHPSLGMGCRTMEPLPLLVLLDLLLRLDNHRLRALLVHQPD